ncbi:hypothetical protein [Streptomyces sp. bgisy027]|uniref:hypothetical protein n=1 Tax=unclassified Streptomyces TaxID=2593676 RepID=UPI003D737732
MDPELIATLVGVAAGGLAAILSDHLRGLLASIFRRPRETSVIVEVDGKRAELSGSQLSPEAIQALIQHLRAAQDDAATKGEPDRPLGGASRD